MFNVVNYFKDVIKLEQLRPKYKELALQFHPDRPEGDTRIMQVINDQYHKLLKQFEGTKLFNKKTNEEYSFKYDYTKEQALMDKIGEVISLKLQNITLEVIGDWLWIHGVSKEQSKLFGREGIGAKFSGKHIAWYWCKTINIFKKRPSGLKLDEIRNYYGSDNVEHERNKQLN